MRSKRDQGYIDRLKDKIADYHEREKEQLAYIRKLQRHCYKNAIGYPVPRELGEAIRDSIDKAKQQKLGEKTMPGRYGPSA